MREYQLIIYGSYGYTGQLIVEECKKKNLRVLLSGRNENKLKRQSEDTGYPFETADIHHPELSNLLKKGQVVIHCAGPFIHTVDPMIRACLQAQTHYTDITGECPVFEIAAGYDKQARDNNIVVMPGTGFDVVPSDCLALHLRKQLPDASHLELAFTMTRGGMSRGTKKTMIEEMGHGGMIRKNGKLISVPLGHDVKEIHFGPFTRKAMCIPWGDLSTAWRSTSIPNIKVYMAASGKMIRNARRSNWLGWLLRQGWVKNYLLKKTEARPAGPDQETREQGRSYLWGKVWNDKGSEVEARLEVPNGYLLTAKTSVLIAAKFLNAEITSGYATPAGYFGEKLILEVNNTNYFKGSN